MNGDRSRELETLQHWTQDQLLDRLYGVTTAEETAEGPRDTAAMDRQAGRDRHLESCAKCAVRWREVQVRRNQVVGQAAEPLVSDQFLAAQRARIYARLEDGPRRSTAWVPAAVAAMCVLLVGFLLNQSATQPQTDAADAQLFADVYSMEQSVEPQAAVPIHALFEDGQ